jgi:hypothetical protein
MLTLLEEVVLLAVDERGELHSARECWTEYALAGAVLFDMSLAGRIDTDTEEVTIVDCAGCGNPIVDRWLDQMSARPDLRTVEHWIEDTVPTVFGGAHTNADPLESTHFCSLALTPAHRKSTDSPPIHATIQSC